MDEQLDCLARSRETATERVLQRPSEIAYSDLLRFIRSDHSASDAVGHDATATALRTASQKYNRPWLLKCLSSEALAQLPAWLSQICQSENEPFRTRYCLNLEKAIRDYMGSHALECGARIAETTITKAVRRQLEFALSEGVPVPIVGESRYGKTKSVANWCEMNPGRARMVTVPESNSELAFIRAHADALGIEYSANTSCPSLKDKVEFVTKRAGLAIIYDEAHYLVPTNYRAATPPRRLNWIRAKLIDRGVPVAFFATPQSYKQTLSQYAEETGYRIEQWLGRVAPAVILSDVIPFDEIVAVARIQFPELTQSLLEELADRAITSDGYLKSLELAGKFARFLARERGHAKPTSQDVTDACNEMMPASPRVITEAPKRSPRGAIAPVAVIQQQGGSRPAEAPPRAADQEFPRRSTAPEKLVQQPVTAG